MNNYGYCCDYNGGTFDALRKADMTAASEMELMKDLEMMAVLIERMEAIAF